MRVDLGASKPLQLFLRGLVPSMLLGRALLSLALRLHGFFGCGEVVR